MAATIQNIELPKKPRALDSSTSIQEIGQEILANVGLGTGNSTIASDTYSVGWTDEFDTGEATIVSNQLVLTNVDGAPSNCAIKATNGTNNSVLVDGSRYSLTYTVVSINTGTVDVTNFRFVDGANSITGNPITVGTHTVTFTAGGTHLVISNDTNDSILVLDDISLKQVENFSNNNHGKIYSGRALEFDGVTDYFQHNGGTALSGVNQFDDGVPWTFACWIYFDSSHANNTHYFVGEDGTTNPMLVFQNQDATNKLQFRADDAGADYYLFPHGHGPSLNKMEQDTWHRLVVTTDGVSVTAYVNGVHGGDITDGQDSTDESGTFSNTGMEFSGWGSPYQSGTRSQSFKGMMSDGQVWDATWSADDAAYDYANPESLALNASGTALTEANLKLWYPMQDGHRGQQSYILDGANTGLGVNLITNGDFEGITLPVSSTVAVGGWRNNTGLANGWSIANGKASLEGEQLEPAHLRQDAVFSVPPDEGSLVYKCVITISNRTAGSIRFNPGGYESFGPFDTNGTHTAIIKPTDASSNTNFYVQASSDFAGSVDNVEVYAINDKHHATTVFYGDDLWDLADNSVANFAVVAGSSAGVIGGATDGVKLTFGGTAEEVNGSYIALKDTSTNTLTEDLTVGRTYKLSGKFATDVAGATNAPRPAVWTSTSNYASSPTVPATNLVANGTMEANDNWNVYSSGTVSQSTTQKHNGSNSFKFVVANGGANDGTQSDAFTVTANTTYLLSAWVYPDDTTTVTIKILEGNGSTTQTENVTGLTENAWNKIERQFVNVNAGSSAAIRFTNTGTNSSGSNDTYYIDDVVYTAFIEKEIEFTATNATDNTFNHFNCEYSATNEMIQIGSNANNSTFATGVGDWVLLDESGSNAAISHSIADGGFVTINDTTDNEGEGLKLPTANIADIEIGRSYTVLVEMKAASDTPGVRVQFGAHTTATQTITTDRATYAYKLTPTTTTNSLLVYTSSTANIDILVYNVQVFPHCNLYADDISFKEVGTASGWTDADQQLDIAQPALQSYNELAWVTDTGEYVEIADHNDFSFDTGGTDDPFSLSAWIYQAEDDALYILTKGGHATYHKLEYRLYANSSQGIYFYLYDGPTASSGANNGVYFRWYSGNDSITKGKWHHIVATYSGTTPSGTSDTNGKIYIDGVNVTTTSQEGGTYVRMSNQALSLMMFKAGTSGAFTGPGSITEAAVWADELSAAEVVELYNDGKALDATTHSATANIKGYWRNNGLSTWTNVKNPGTHDATVTNITETLLIPQGVDGSRDTQGFIMNKARNTSSANMPSDESKIECGPFTDILADGVSTASMECWMKADGTEGSGSYAAFAGERSGRNILLCRENATSKAQALYSTSTTGNNNALISTTADVFDNNWHHIAFTFGESDGVGKLYIDGSQEDTDTKAGETLSMDAATFFVGGGDDAGNDRSFNGTVDGVKVYSDALSATEVQRNYNATKGSHR